MKKLNELHEEIINDLYFTESSLVKDFCQVVTAVNADKTINGAAALLTDKTILVMVYTDKGIVSQIVGGLTLDEMTEKLKKDNVIVKKHY